MTKVLMIGMTEGVGGVETFICNVKKNLSLDVHMDFLVHQDINERYYADILSNNSKIFKVTGIKENIFKFLKDIFKFYKHNKYDVVHINECDAKMFIYAIPLLFDKNTKLIIHSHSTSTENKYVHGVLKFFQNQRANIKIACSDMAYKFMFGECENKIIIHNGIDLGNFSYDKDVRVVKRKELGIEDEIVLCSIARFTAEKNHKKIVDIFYEFNKINKNSKLVLVGVGPLEEEIKDMVKELNISNRVLFLGNRYDVNQLLSALDVFLLPSLFEGLPFVSLEGQACSILFFASNNVSREIAVTDLVHFLDLKQDSEEWAREIENVLNSKINRESIIYQQKIKNAGFDIKEVCENLEKIYKE